MMNNEIKNVNGKNSFGLDFEALDARARGEALNEKQKEECEKYDDMCCEFLLYDVDFSAVIARVRGEVLNDHQKEECRKFDELPDEPDDGSGIDWDAWAARVCGKELDDRQKEECRKFDEQYRVIQNSLGNT